MANLVFNISKGRIAYYASLPAANDALILIPLQASGLESDATLVDKDTFSDVVSGATNEHTAGRKTLASVTVTVDDANDRVNLDAADVTYTGIGSGGQASKWVICYDPDTTGGTDADLVPMTMHDLSWTPDGNNFTITITDFARAS